MDDLTTQLLAVVLSLMAYVLMLATLRTLSARLSLSLKRHDLVVQSKLRRLQFMREIDQQQEGEMAEADVIFAEPFEDDAPPALRPAA